jgi:predicted porin
MKTVMEYVGLDGEERESDFVGYYSPKMAGLQFQAATMPGSYEEAQLGDAYSLALVYGDPKHKKSNFYAGLSYDSNVDGKKDDDYDTSLVRFAASAKFGNFFLGGIAEQADNSTNDSQMRYVASASYKMGDAKLMLQYANADQYYENNNNDEGAEQITAGISYSLSKEAAAYLAYSQKDAYDKDADKNLESDHVLLGFVYKF